MRLKKLLGCYFVISLFMPTTVFSQKKIETFRIVIYDFQVSTDGLPKNYSTILPELIRPFFVNEEKFEVLERCEMARLWKDHSNAEKLPDVFDNSTAVKIGKFLEANYAVFGKVNKLDDTIIISSRMVEVETGIIKSESFVSCHENEDIIKIIEQLAHSIIFDIKELMTQKGEVYLQVTPSNSKVSFSDGTTYLSTPISKKLKTGSYTATIIPEQEIYANTSITFDITANKTTQLQVKLKKRTGKLAIKFPFRPIAIYLDGKFQTSSSDTILQVDAGYHTLTILSSSGLTYNETIFVHSDIINEIKLQKSEECLQNQAEKQLVGKRNLLHI